MAAPITRASLTETTSPVNKVIQMLSSLQAKIIAEEKEAQKTYDEFTEWCEERSRNVGFEIKTSKTEISELTASMEKSTSIITASSTKIEELSSSIAKTEADLTAATQIREEEAADFAAESKETKDIIATLERAIAVLTREAAKHHGAAMLQVQNANNLIQAFQAMVQASWISESDASRLSSLLQSNQGSEDSAPPVLDGGMGSGQIADTGMGGGIIADTGMGGPGPSTKPAVLDTGMGGGSTKPLLVDTGMGGGSTKPLLVDTGMG